MKKIIILAGFLGILAGSTTSVFAGYFNNTPALRCNTQITSTLQIGSENHDVEILQNLLSASGYLYANANGYFGPSTKAAVKRFQSANSLPATGIVGESTRNAINERLCDSDVLGNSSSYDMYGNANGMTYVDQYDPYVKVISPKVTTPVVYATPQENNNSFSPTLLATNGSVASSYYPPVDTTYQVTDGIVPSTPQIQSTNIVYNPMTGYTYGIVPRSGSLTITSPSTNSIYNEGDIINLTWTTSNLNANGFRILLENANTSQSKQVAVTNGMNVSFVLTRDLLDAVSSSASGYNYGQQESFRVVITTPVTDIAGVTSTFRAMVSSITIKRPYSYRAAVTINTGKDPVDSGEKFRIYVNSPAINSLDILARENTTVKLHAICINNIQVSIAGVPCGQDFVMPLSALASQSGIPTMITNTSWLKQAVVFEVTLIDPLGVLLGSARTTVNANPAPLSW